jgi:fucose permease
MTVSQKDTTQAEQRLPILFWVYWVAIVMAVSAEFCMIFWSADYLENVFGMPKANAAQAVSLFFAAMILGRMAGSRLVRLYSTSKVLTASILTASLGFLLFWRTSSLFLGLSGLFLTGLGIASLYPLILALTIGSANNNTVQASARATLASGTAILTLPLVLGRLADAVGIRLAYGVVALLLLSVLLIIQIAGRMSPAHSTVPTG